MSRNNQQRRDTIRIRMLEKSHNCVTVSLPKTRQLHIWERHIPYDLTSAHLPTVLRSLFGSNIRFDNIIMDYFRSPTSWLSDTVRNWTRTLYSLGTLLHPTGSIIIPQSILLPDIPNSEIPPHENPLWLATSFAGTQLDPESHNDAQYRFTLFRCIKVRILLSLFVYVDSLFGSLFILIDVRQWT